MPSRQRPDRSRLWGASGVSPVRKAGGQISHASPEAHLCEAAPLRVGQGHIAVDEEAVRLGVARANNSQPAVKGGVGVTLERLAVAGANNSELGRGGMILAPTAAEGAIRQRQGSGAIRTRTWRGGRSTARPSRWVRSRTWPSRGSRPATADAKQATRGGSAHSEGRKRCLCERWSERQARSTGEWRGEAITLVIDAS